MAYKEVQDGGGQSGVQKGAKPGLVAEPGAAGALELAEVSLLQIYGSHSRRQGRRCLHWRCAEAGIVGCGGGGVASHWAGHQRTSAQATHR